MFQYAASSIAGTSIGLTTISHYCLRSKNEIISKVLCQSYSLLMTLVSDVLICMNAFFRCVHINQW